MEKQPLLASLAQDNRDYLCQWLDVHEWMSKVPPFDSGKAVWHFHPVEFLAVIRVLNKWKWAYSPFGNLLGKVESRNDYTAYNRTYPHPKPKYIEVHYHTNLTSMTIKQIMDAQKKHEMFAVGRFQIIPGTLDAAVKALKLDGATPYNERLRIEYLKST